MFEKDENEKRFLEIVTLTDSSGKTYSFQVIDEVKMKGHTYLITIPEEGPENEKLIIIESKDNNYSIVHDEQKLNELQKYLEQMTLDEDIESITLLGKDGKRYDYHVIDKVEKDGCSYLISLDINSFEDEYTIFLVKDNELLIVEDEDLIDDLIFEFEQKHELEDIYSDKDMCITLEDDDGSLLELNIMGKLEIKGKEYLIASKEENKEFIAISDTGNDIKIIKDKAIMDEINFYLFSLQRAIMNKKVPSPELN